MEKKRTFQKGIRDGFPIAMGYLSVSFAFGMLAVQKGLPLWSPMLISLTNFTGTGQFAGIDLIAAGAAFFEIAVTLLIINLRYLLMSLSLSQRLAADMPLWQRLLVAFGNTDEIFAVSMQQNQLLNFSYLAGLILISFSGWNLGTFLGAFASSVLPASVRSALGIALYAMFIAIIVPPAKNSKPILYVAALSVILSCLLRWLPVVRQLSGGWVIIVCGIAASAFGAKFYPVLELKEEQKDE